MDTHPNYKIHYFVDDKGIEPVKEYIDSLSVKEQEKVFSFIDLLLSRNGYLDQPYSKHIEAKIRELIIDFSKNHHRIFYFTFTGKKIVLLHAFLKTTRRTPINEILRARNNHKYFLKTKDKYD